MQFINYKIKSTTYGRNYVGHLLANDEIKITFIDFRVGWIDMRAFIYSTSKHAVILFRESKNFKNILIYKNNKNMKKIDQYRLETVRSILDELKGKTFNDLYHFVQAFNDKQKERRK